VVWLIHSPGILVEFGFFLSWFDCSEDISKLVSLQLQILLTVLASFADGRACFNAAVGLTY
jgi:hypothetical protein